LLSSVPTLLFAYSYPPLYNIVHAACRWLPLYPFSCLFCRHCLPGMVAAYPLAMSSGMGCFVPVLLLLGSHSMHVSPTRSSSSLPFLLFISTICVSIVAVYVLAAYAYYAISTFIPRLCRFYLSISHRLYLLKRAALHPAFLARTLHLFSRPACHYSFCHAAVAWEHKACGETLWHGAGAPCFLFSSPAPTPLLHACLR